MPKRPAKPSSDNAPKPGAGAEKNLPDAPQEAPPQGTDLGDVVHDPDAAAAAIAAMQTQQKKIIIGAIVVAVLITGVVIARQIVAAKHVAASEAYSVAVDGTSVDKLNMVVSEFAGSTGAGNALLSRAELELTSGKAEDAKATLTRFTKEYAEHPRLMQGYYALGSIEHNSGNLDAALGQYSLALQAGPDSELAPLIKIRQADISREKGDTEAARQLYDAIPQSHPANPFIDVIDQRLAALDAPEILRVKAPPAPKPEPGPEPKKATDKPKADKPPAPAIKPAADKPTAPATKPAADKPNADKPAAPATKPAADKPKADKPAAPATKPAADKPKADKPAAPATKPAAPATPKPNAADKP